MDILSFLSGTAATFIAGRIFDFYQDKRKHKQHLQQLLFERKIGAAEKLVSTLSLTSVTLAQTSLLYKRLNEKDIFTQSTEAELLVDNNLQETIQKYNSILSEDKNNLMSSINLYFDIEGEQEYLAAMLDLHNILGLLGEKDQNIDKALALYEKVKDTEHRSNSIAYFNEVEADYKQHIALICERFDYANDRITNVVKQLRAIVKKIEE